MLTTGQTYEKPHLADSRRGGVVCGGWLSVFLLGERCQRTERQRGRHTTGLPALNRAPGNPDLVSELLCGHASLFSDRLDAGGVVHDGPVIREDDRLAVGTGWVMSGDFHGLGKKAVGFVIVGLKRCLDLIGVVIGPLDKIGVSCLTEQAVGKVGGHPLIVVVVDVAILIQGDVSDLACSTLDEDSNAAVVVALDAPSPIALEGFDPVAGAVTRGGGGLADFDGRCHGLGCFGVGSRVVQLGRHYARRVKSTSIILRNLRNSFFRPDRGPLNVNVRPNRPSRWPELEEGRCGRLGPTPC